MKPVNLLLSLLLCISTNLFGQIEKLTAHSPNDGEERVIAINITQSIDRALERTDLAPLLMVLNTEVVEVNPKYKEHFQQFVEEQNELYQYRYLEHLCEHDLHVAAAQSVEGQMMVLRKEIHAGNVVSSLLEKYMQLKLEKFFAAPVCFAYRLNRTQEYPMAKMAKEFSADWVISPTIVKADTCSEGIRCLLQLEVWDAQKDSLRFIKAFEQKAASLKASVEGAVAKAGGYMISNLIRDQNFREVAKLSFQRGQYFQQLLAQQNPAWVKQMLAKNDLSGGFVGGLINEDSSRFMAFTLGSYTPDFEEKISNKLYRNPYEDVDVTQDMDPDRARFTTTTYAGIKFEGEWVIKPIQKDWIYTSDSAEALKAYYAGCANLGIFEDGMAQLHENYWYKGFFTPVDTAKMKYKHDTAKVKNWKVNFAIDKLNMAPYQGLPRFFADEMFRHYRWGKSGAWRKEVAEKHLKDIFIDLEVRRIRDIRYIDTERRSYQMLHDYEMTKGLVALWVEEPWAKKALRFFYWDQERPDELYEWTYLPKVIYDKKKGDPKMVYVVRQVNKVMPWNYIRATVDDEKFWQEKVLARENGEYKYLVKVSAD